MAVQWYCDLMGKIVGPMTAQQLMEKVRRGEVSGTTPIRKDDSKWFPASEVNGLFEAAFREADQKQKQRMQERFRSQYYEEDF